VAAEFARIVLRAFDLLAISLALASLTLPNDGELPRQGGD
jgi:hypothetical protein